MANEEVFVPPKVSPWIITIAVVFPTFVDALNSSIANVALKDIAGTFSITNDESLWILTSFLIAMSVLLPASAWCSNVFGRKKFFLGCLTTFGLASFICGIAPNFQIMIAARVIQGLSGGPLFPLSQAILLESFPKSEHGKAMAAFGMCVVLAPVVGPILGGYLTSTYSWNWVFFISIPFIVIGGIMVSLYVEDPPYMQAMKNPPKIDILGFLLLIIWLASFQTMLSDGQKNGWFDSVYIVKLGWTALISFTALIWWELKNKKNPLFDLMIFKNWNFTIGSFVFAIAFAVLFAAMAILPQFLQSLMGYDAFLAGIAAAPMGLGSMVGIIIAGAISKAIDLRKQIAAGCVVIILGCLMFSNLNLSVSIVNVSLPNFMFGLGISLLMVPCTTIIFSYVSNSEMTNASSLQNLLKNIGSSIGSTSVGISVSTYMQMHQTNLVQNMSIYNPVFQQRLNAMTSAFSQYSDHITASTKANIMLYKQLLQQSTLSAYISSYKLFALVMIGVIPLIFLLKRVKYEKE